MTVIAHLSDLHFGTEEPELVDALLAELSQVAPALVVVSGDFTQRARSSQFVAARAFLDRLPAPWLSIPGNHDLPIHLPHRRLLSPRGNYFRHITPDRHPVAELDGAVIAGLDTTHARRWASGRVRSKHHWVIDRLGQAPPDVLRVLVTHHPVADDAFAVAAAAGVDVMLAGHLHTGGPAELRDGRLLVQAGTALSWRRRGEPNAFNVLRWSAPALEVTEYAWDGAWSVAGREEFARSAGGRWAPA